MDIEATAATTPVAVARPARRIYRHRLPVRVMHWINVVCMTVLLMSGLNIFNAHPALYWGHESTFAKPWISFGARNTPNGPVGYTRIGSTEFDTTRVLGLSATGADHRPTARAFPSWATVPGPQWLAMARHWHLFFAWLFVVNGIAYVVYTLLSRHLTKDLIPTREELRNIGRSIVDHIKFKHPTGDAATRYNVLQSLTYLIVIFVLLPLIVVCGLAMSPTLNTVFTGWVDVLGGRQSARTLHFAAMSLFVLFFAVHVLMVVYAGPVNHVRSMLTGRFRVRWPRGENGDG